jgi:hypothetical protein
MLERGPVSGEMEIKAARVKAVWKIQLQFGRPPADAEAHFIA